ncbi:hypothetical protein [Desulfosporosinus nitroreducens]|uniref:Uncharacterized protein n=1 Tax=Desulfosporosinus nitroreducens TaxID=2018668 RepID=A0ABT8QW26_9FIRM|nr:hypothetical protein [Desulfosporosinus nitroreducens]MDO0825538.1 hypothetical protein [Desulfosporosinus nitroreducens]
MLSGKLEAGNYRIVTDIWYANEPLPQTIRHVWAGFTINEGEEQRALDKVRKSAEKVLLSTMARHRSVLSGR